MKKVKNISIFLVVVTLLQVYSHYIKFDKVDNDFLDIIVSKIEDMENKRISIIAHTYQDNEKLWHDLNTGIMGHKSRKEADISSEVNGMSHNLMDYSYFKREKKFGDGDKAKISLEKYFENLQELKNLLEPFKLKNENVKRLWDEGIFE